MLSSPPAISNGTTSRSSSTEAQPRGPSQLEPRPPEHERPLVLVEELRCRVDAPAHRHVPGRAGPGERDRTVDGHDGRGGEDPADARPGADPTLQEPACDERDDAGRHEEKGNHRAR